MSVDSLRINLSGSPVRIRTITICELPNGTGMQIQDGRVIQSVGEHEIDFSVVELLETSEPFRQWLSERLAPEVDFDTYLGAVAHVAYAGEGESDIEFGMQTNEGDTYCFLIENKITATKQPDQIDRYYKRGDYRTRNNDWDEFQVCLIAPERYISKEDKTGFESILHYEDLRDQTRSLEHDGAPFITEVVETALEKSARTVTEDASETLQAIADQFLQTTTVDTIQRVAEVADYNKRVSFESTHPAHPDELRYDVFIGELGATGHTSIRLQIASSESLSEADREALKTIVSTHAEELQNYRTHLHRKVNVAVSQVDHAAIADEGTVSDHVDLIVDRLDSLVTTFHPIAVRKSMEKE